SRYLRTDRIQRPRTPRARERPVRRRSGGNALGESHPARRHTDEHLGLGLASRNSDSWLLAPGSSSHGMTSITLRSCSSTPREAAATPSPALSPFMISTSWLARSPTLTSFSATWVPSTTKTL